MALSTAGLGFPILCMRNWVEIAVSELKQKHMSHLGPRAAAAFHVRKGLPVSPSHQGVFPQPAFCIVLVSSY